MKIVIDTNVVISAAFFGGLPRKICHAVVWRRLDAYANAFIVSEYERAAEKGKRKGIGFFHAKDFYDFVNAVEMIRPIAEVNVCRDPDDNKFLACAKDAKALYIVSGDKDLLVLREFEGTEILTVAEFCARYPNLIL